MTHRSGVVVGVLVEPKVHAHVAREQGPKGGNGIEAIPQLLVPGVAGLDAQVEQTLAHLHVLGMVVLLPALGGVVQALGEDSQGLATQDIATAAGHVGLKNGGRG